MSTLDGGDAPQVVEVAAAHRRSREAYHSAARRPRRPLFAQPAQPPPAARQPPSAQALVVSLLAVAVVVAISARLSSSSDDAAAAPAAAAAADEQQQRVRALLQKLDQLQHEPAATRTPAPSPTSSLPPASATASQSPAPVQQLLVPPGEVLWASATPSSTQSPAARSPAQSPAARRAGAVVALLQDLAAQAGGGLVAGLRRASSGMRRISIPAPVMQPDGYYDDAAARGKLQSIIDGFWKGATPAAPERAAAGARVHPADIMVATYYTPTGKFAYFRQCDYGAYLHANRWRYASIHGYQYDIGAQVLDDTRPLPWQKVLWIMKWLQKAKWVLLIDADALISGMAPRVEDLIDDDEQHDFVFARDGNGINSGIAIFKSTPLTFKFLEDAYRSVEHLNHPWWEQRAFMDLLSARSEYAARLKVVPQRSLNSYPPGLLGPDGWWHRGDLVLHYPGSKGGDYARAIEHPQGNVDGAFPPCRAGDELGAWERWADGPAAQPAAAAALGRPLLRVDEQQRPASAGGGYGDGKNE